jgi:CRP-like cAMP-binding protein
VLHEPGLRMRDVYFPDGCLISLLAAAEQRGAIEVGMVGSEGMVGLPVGLGFSTSPARSLVQHAGLALRASAPHFRAELGRSADLRREIARCAHVAMSTAMQISACNNRHSLQSRLARWLLMTHDRVLSGELALTQQWLAQMLGVQREGVTKAASTLRRRKLIEYVRGKIRILDLDGLRASACSCYKVIAKLDGTL